MKVLKIYLNKKIFLNKILSFFLILNLFNFNTITTCFKIINNFNKNAINLKGFLFFKIINNFNKKSINLKGFFMPIVIWVYIKILRAKKKEFNDKLDELKNNMNNFTAKDIQKQINELRQTVHELLEENNIHSS